MHTACRPSFGHPASTHERRGTGSVALAALVTALGCGADPATEPYYSGPHRTTDVNVGDADASDPRAPGDARRLDADADTNLCGLGTTLQTCVHTCSSATDCTVELIANGAYGADNYRCVNGTCAYLGCTSDAECGASTASAPGTYRCLASQCASLPRYCVHACATAADCVAESAAGGAFGADNYSCAAGVCTYLGCRGDTECAVSLGASGRAYRCAPTSYGPSACQAACSAAADCSVGSAAWDTDNYRCAAGVCEWTGCNSTAECASSLASSSYVCAR
ncbi:MAG: hypothetical protein HY903_23140 [Deltaproteobacteria bacterium]|nr:hypothetical protein [Deltaproteobacteria bacterium]